METEALKKDLRIREFQVVTSWCSVWVKVDDGIVVGTATKLGDVRDIEKWVGKSYSGMFSWIDRKSNGKVRVFDLQQQQEEPCERKHRFYKNCEM